jgi:hypothetical protein
MRGIRSVVGAVSAAALGTIALVLTFGVNAAELPKRGSYQGVFAWHATGQPVEVEKDHVLWGDKATGSFRNDAGDGFLHAAVVVCTAAGEFKQGKVIHDSGNCVATDKDGDKAVLTWKCTSCPSETQTGEFQWTGGTGKYAGLKGRTTYQQTNVGPGIGWSVWKGEWERP